MLPRRLQLALLSSLALALHGPAQSAPTTITAARPVLTLAWHDGPALVAGLEELLDSLELPPRQRGFVDLARAGLRLQLAGRDLGEVVSALAPAGGAISVAADVANGAARWWLCAAPPPDTAVDLGAAEQLADDRADLLDLLSARGLVVADDASGLVVAPDRATAATAQRRLIATDRPAPWSLAAVPGTGDAPRAALRATLDLAALPAERRSWRDLDAGGRFLIGPWAAVADGSSRLDGDLSLHAGGIELQLRADASARALAGPLLPRHPGNAPPPAPPGTLAVLRLDRSLRNLIIHRDALLRPGDAAQLGGGLTIADTLSGASFVDDLLGPLEEPFTIFAVDSPPTERSPDDPGFDLPGFALVVPLHSTLQERLLRARMRRTWATLWLASNVERKRNQELTFTVRPRQRDDLGATLFVAEPDTWRGPPPAPTEADLTPTFAVAHGHLVLASTADAAARVVGALRDAGAGDDTAPLLTRGWSDLLRLAPRAAAAFVDRNIDLLTLQKMLDEGASANESRRELLDLTAILRAIDSIELRSEEDRVAGTTTLALRLTTLGTASREGQR